VNATRYFFGPLGELATEAPSAGSEQEYRSDPSARPAQTLHGQDGSNAWLALPNYDWPPVPDSTALSYVSEPFTQDTVMAGTASADLYLTSSATDTDLQVTITEVRPDGTEMYVQSGWLRASHRALDEDASTELDPQPTHLEQDAAPLPDGEAALVRVSVFPFAHAFREGSRIRIIISAPGGDRAIWQFDTIEKGDTRNTLLLGGSEASSIVLPVLAGVKAGGPLPPCPSNRGQPCRPYQEASTERPSA
jgi:putative CocE/NonD family hydrolase